MRKLLLSLLFICVCAATIAQTVTLTFTAQDAENHYVQLNRVAIANLTKGWQEIISWPDTVLTMQDGTGVDDYTENGGLALSQNNPNPFDGATFVNLKVAEQGNVAIEITDITGRIVGANKYSSLQPGIHEMRITLSSPGLYFLTARQNGRTVSVKMVNRGHGGGNAVTITGVVGANHDSPLPQPKNAHRGATDNPFEAGDRMEYVGYAVINGVEVESNHVLRQQYASQMLMLTFGNPQGDSLSCPGSPTVVDVDGNIYNTVQIGDQCWMRENLRATSCVDGTQIPASSNYYSNYNDIDPIYYDFASSNIPLQERGYVYNWPAAIMVCPEGWHLPSDTEWTNLMDYMSSQSEYTCGGNSNAIAKALSSTMWWWGNVDNCDCCPGDQSVYLNNASGFGAVPICSGSDSCVLSTFWSSTTQEPYAKRLLIWYSSVRVYSDSVQKYRFSSVRCLRGEGGISASLPTVTTNAVSDITATMATCGGNVTATGNAVVTARGVCWSTSPNPTVSGSHTTDGTGSGSFISSITGLAAGNTYYVRAYATNSVGTAYGNEVTFSTYGGSCPGTPTVTDADGNVYNTVRVGNQCWMRENLRTTKYADGTDISAGEGNYSNTDAYYYDYNSSNIPLNERGYLYNWPAAVQGVCPIGWHLPSDAEWTQLMDYVNSVSNHIAKSLASSSGWNTTTNYGAVGNDQSTNNVLGFGAVPAGHWFYGFYDEGSDANFWSSTEYSSGSAWYRGLQYSSAYVTHDYYSKGNGLSIRCLRDASLQPCPGAATVTDYNGNVYNTVQIGDQCWMRENLRVTHYSDGTLIPAGGENDWSYTEPYYYDYSSSSIPLVERGYLYNWSAAMHGAASSSAVPSGVQGVCPTGWHLPSDAEWTVLTDYVSSQSEFVCGGDNTAIAKALASTTGWNTSTYNCVVGNNQSVNNASGFGVVPAGNYGGSSFYGAGVSAYLLSATQDTDYTYVAYYRYLFYHSAGVYRDYASKDYGFSVRCLRD